jgi:NADH:ubiquinone oxidoreductase subunit E
MPENNSTKTVLICQNTACRKTGSAKLLAAFSGLLPEGSVIGCGCLGHCGNGPTVVVVPDRAWYHQVHLEQVAAIIQRHFPSSC